MISDLTLEEARSIAGANVCAECGGPLGAPWGGAYGFDSQVVRCLKSLHHEGVQLKRYTKRINGKEFDVETQQAIMPYPQTEQAMVSRFKDSLDIGLFPEGPGDRKITDKQLMNLAKLAMLYHLDPLMKEIMPYQGQAYITIDGRRRIDARAGNHPSFKIPRPLDRETYQALVDMEAINQGDIVLVGEMTDTRTGQTVEVTGRVLASEKGGSGHLPINKWRYEMAQKRWEYRGRRELYGPVALPGGMDGEITLIEEDEVLEAEVQELYPDDSSAETKNAPESYGPLLEKAGGRGLDLEGFCREILAQPDIQTFESIGGTPQIAAKRMDAWEKKQGS